MLAVHIPNINLFRVKLNWNLFAYFNQVHTKLEKVIMHLVECLWHYSCRCHVSFQYIPISRLSCVEALALKNLLGDFILYINLFLFCGTLNLRKNTIYKIHPLNFGPISIFKRFSTPADLWCLQCAPLGLPMRCTNTPRESEKCQRCHKEQMRRMPFYIIWKRVCPLKVISASQKTFSYNLQGLIADFSIWSWLKKATQNYAKIY